MNLNDDFLKEESEKIDIVEEIRYFLFFWPWFLLSIVIFSIASYTYLRYTDTIYSTNAILQVKEASSDPSSLLTEGAGAMFNFSNVKLDNHIAQIKSNINIDKVSHLLDLQTQIYSVGRIKNNLLFGNEIPFHIDFKNPQAHKELILNLNPKESILEIGSKKVLIDNKKTYETKNFILKIKNNDFSKSGKFIIKRISRPLANLILNNSIGVKAITKSGDNINISLLGENKKRNEEIINKLIDVAHKSQINDKQEIYTLSKNFINKRLISIKEELDSLALKSTGFKSDNLIFSPKAQTNSVLLNLNAIEEQNFDLITQKSLANSLSANIENQADFTLLPSNIGLSSNEINILVKSYNELVIKRNTILSGATFQNPLVVQLSDQLSELRANILNSISNYITNIDTSISKYNDFKNEKKYEISKIPELESVLQSYQRNFQIAEKLYLFLLERREEISISNESTLPNTRVIDLASTNLSPVWPNKNSVWLMSIVLGLGVPFLILYILKITDKKVHTRDQLEKFIPNLDILGEVPFVENIKSAMDPRGILAESARVIRSNLSFKLKKNDCNVILCTSSIKGEGKTITAFNIAASYLASGKKVLLIGADLRNPQIHNIVDIDRKTNIKGLSTLITDEVTKDITSDHFTHIDLFGKKLKVLLSGPIPPNPAELLSSKIFSDLINNHKKLYDFIIIDSAPLLLVSDSLPILPLADLVLYTTRAHYTDKKIFSFINNLVKEKKINNIGIVFNAIKSGSQNSNKYGYSYRYSYQYKYNYGYGYGYGEDKSKN